MALRSRMIRVAWAMLCVVLGVVPAAADLDTALARLASGDFARALPELRRVVAEAGRDPDDLHIVPMGVFPDREKLGYYESLGVTEAVLRLPSAARDEVLPVLDEYVPFLG